MYAPLKKVLMKEPQKFQKNINLKKWNYELTLDEDIMNKNYRDFINIIKNSGVEILNLESQNHQDEMYDSIFTHDPSLVIDEGAIILNMAKTLRKNEISDHIYFYNSSNIPIVGKIINNGTVEGGDCLWLNKNTLLIGESSRTNISGIKQLSKILKYYDIETISAKIPKLENSESCFHNILIF